MIFGLGGPDTSSGLIEGCYTLATVPGRTITKSLGTVQFTKKGLAGDMPDESMGIFQSLLEVAKRAGGNAVINVRLITGSYQRQGSQWQVTTSSPMAMRWF
jgi:uncharacterized protein YbjQ (UPF0145 family)